MEGGIGRVKLVVYKNNQIAATYESLALIGTNWNLPTLLEVIGSQIDINTVTKFLDSSNPEQNLLGGVFSIKPDNSFEIHLKGTASQPESLPLPRPVQRSSDNLKFKVINEERVRVHEFHQDLDPILESIVQPDFYISPQLAKEFAGLFDGLANCHVGQIASSAGYLIDDEFERYIRHGITLWEKFNTVLLEPRPEAYWHMHFYVPLLSSCCLGPTPSGLLKFRVSPKIILGQAARALYTKGILPDVSDGWMFVQSNDARQKPASIKISNQLYDAKTLPIADYDFKCGDRVILMPDFFAEFKGSPEIDLEHDREKLFGEMAVSSQCFVQILNYNPYVFGLTTSGPQFRFYAMKSTEKKNQLNRSEKQSDSKDYDHLVDDAKQGKTRAKRSPSAPTLFQAGVAEKEEPMKEEDDVDNPEDNEEEEPFYECYYLANIQVDTFATYMRVLMILWRMRMFRRVHMRHYKVAFLDKMPGVKRVTTDGQAPNAPLNNNINIAHPHTQASGATNSQDVTKALGNLTVALKAMNLTPSEKFLNSCRDSLVIKAVTPDAKQVVAKFFSSQQQFDKEKQIYEQLEAAGFNRKPKLLHVFEEKGVLGLVMEYIEGQNDFKITSERELVNFTVALLQTVQMLHSRCIIHGDIKLDNLVYDAQQGTVNLLDFGFSELCLEDYVDRRGSTPDYLPYYYQPMTFRDDLYNVGALLAGLIYGVDPSEVGWNYLWKATKNGQQPLFNINPSFIEIVHRLLKTKEAYEYAAEFALSDISRHYSLATASQWNKSRI